MEIRDAEESDRDDLTRTHVEAVRGVDPDTYDEGVRSVWETGAGSVEYPIGASGTVVLVAERDGELAGFAEASFEESELDKLYVDPAHQNEGVATALSRAVDRRLRSNGVETVYVEASLNAEPFYERVGYERVGTHHKTVRNDDATVEMVVVDMEKELTPTRPDQ